MSAADVAADTGPPDWVETPAQRPAAAAGAIAAPADAVDDDGEISLGEGRAAIVGTTTVNLALRTPDEQAALIEGWGRWLNSLSTPTQIVVSAQPVDLASHSRALAAAADTQPHPRLRAACTDHAEFLGDLAARRDPLRRQVLVVTRAAPASAPRRAAASRRHGPGAGGPGRLSTGPGRAGGHRRAGRRRRPVPPAQPGRVAAPDTVITAATPTSRTRRSP